MEPDIDDKASRTGHFISTEPSLLQHTENIDSYGSACISSSTLSTTSNDGSEQAGEKDWYGVSSQKCPSSSPSASTSSTESDSLKSSSLENASRPDHTRSTRYNSAHGIGRYSNRYVTPRYSGQLSAVVDLSYGRPPSRLTLTAPYCHVSPPPGFACRSNNTSDDATMNSDYNLKCATDEHKTVSPLKASNERSSDTDESAKKEVTVEETISIRLFPPKGSGINWNIAVLCFNECIESLRNESGCNFIFCGARPESPENIYLPPLPRNQEPFHVRIEAPSSTTSEVLKEAKQLAKTALKKIVTDLRGQSAVGGHRQNQMGSRNGIHPGPFPGVGVPRPCDFLFRLRGHPIDGAAWPPLPGSAVSPHSTPLPQFLTPPRSCSSSPSHVLPPYRSPFPQFLHRAGPDMNNTPAPASLYPHTFWCNRCGRKGHKPEFCRSSTNYNKHYQEPAPPAFQHSARDYVHLNYRGDRQPFHRLNGGQNRASPVRAGWTANRNEDDREEEAYMSDVSSIHDGGIYSDDSEATQERKISYTKVKSRKNSTPTDRSSSTGSMESVKEKKGEQQAACKKDSGTGFGSVRGDGKRGMENSYGHELEIGKPMLADVRSLPLSRRTTSESGNGIRPPTVGFGSSSRFGSGSTNSGGFGSGFGSSAVDCECAAGDTLRLLLSKDEIRNAVKAEWPQIFARLSPYLKDSDDVADKMSKLCSNPGECAQS